MSNIKLHIILLLFAATLLSCGGTPTAKEWNVAGDTLQMHHSSLLQIIDCDGFSIVNVNNPWREGAMLHRYMLLHRDSTIQTPPQGVTLLRTPLENQLIFTTLHAQLIADLGRSDAITGVCDAQYMSVPQVRNGLADGTITDCGNSLDVNTERLVELTPEAAWVVPFKNGGYGKLEKTGTPLIECADYMESSPLGCAEWMRFYGRLLGVADKADSLFFAVCESYESTKNLTATCAHRPKLMCELKSGAAWYVPSGGSTMGKLYNDAGADYLFATGGGSGSVPLAFETILARADSADVWLFKYNAENDKTYTSLKEEFSGYTLLRPYQERKIYACNTRRRPFYEETPFRPDILLEELVMLLHPELDNGYKFRYYERLQE